MSNSAKKIGEPSECVCTRSDGLFIPNRQLSSLIAFSLTIFLISFLSGYFFGKKHMVEQFVAKVEQDSFADQIYSSLCALGDYDVESIRSLESAEVVKSNEPAQDGTVQEIVKAVSEEVESHEQIAQLSEDQDQAVSSKQYFAKLIGFGSQGAAHNFYKKMKSKNIAVLLKERVSMSAKGKKRTWYQVITEPYEDRNALEELVDRIAKEEKLMGVQIVTC